MHEIDPLISSYQHDTTFPRAADALLTLRKVASLVKPIMRQRGWRVGTLTEFFPPEQNLLGLNWNRGQKICLRLRYPGDKSQFLPTEQVVDTMLHELCHIVHGPHDEPFHTLWNQLRDEHESLLRKGYTGEGFLSTGHKLGGGSTGRLPMHEAQRRARAAAEKRRTLTAGSGQKLGGAPVRRGEDIRRVIADAAQRRITVTKGCASDTERSRGIVEETEKQGTRTEAVDLTNGDEEAIMLAYIDLIQEEEKEKYGEGYIQPSKEHPAGSQGVVAAPSKPQANKSPPPPPIPSSTKPPPKRQPANLSADWTCDICTLLNLSTYLVCDACGTERPSPKPSPLTNLQIEAKHRSSNKNPKSSPLTNKKSALENIRIIEEQAKKVPEKPMGWKIAPHARYWDWTSVPSLHPIHDSPNMPSTSEDPSGSVRASFDGMIPYLDDFSNEVNHIADSIEKHFKAVASSLLEYPVAASIRETIQSSPWLYEQPARPPPPHRVVPVRYLEACRRWVSEHRAVTAAVVAFVGTGAFVIWRRRRADRTKRRAKRAKNGSRTEVVVLAGSPHSPLTKSLSLDLERRGFIVYVPVSSLSEERALQAEGRTDIRPLHLDITSVSFCLIHPSDVSIANDILLSQEQITSLAIQKLTTYLTTPHRPHPQSPPHTLNLASLILIPPLSPPTQPISAIPPAIWADTLNTHLLSPITLLRAFIPLLTSQKSALLILTPSVIPSLNPASHGPESVITAALHAYIKTLRREIPSTDLRITNLKLGTFDYGPTSTAERQLVAFRTAQAREKGEEVRKGSPLRELHNCVFDVVARGRRRGGTVFVGRGSWMYDVVGRWVPAGVVGWMMGLRKRRGAETNVGTSQEWEKVEREG